MHMHVLNRHLLLALSAMQIEGLEQRRPSARELICLVEVLPPTFHGLIIGYCAPVALHGGIYVQQLAEPPS
jgi:hypothetical protein